MSRRPEDAVVGIELKMTVTLGDGEEVVAVKALWDRESQGLTVMANSGLVEVGEGFLKDAVPLMLETINKSRAGEPGSNLYVSPPTAKH